MKLKRKSAKVLTFALVMVTFVGFCLYRSLSSGDSIQESSTSRPAAVASEDGKNDAEKKSGKKPVAHGASAASGLASSQNEDRGEYWITLNEPPHIAYIEFLDRAEAGDASAQLVLTEVLERCRYSSVQTPQSLAGLEARGDISPEMLDHYRGKLTECSGLYELLREYDLDSLWAFWMGEAADKLPLAKLALSLENLETEYSDELYRQLQAGIIAAKGDWIQERLVRKLAFSFFRTFIEPTQYDASVQDAGYYVRGEDSLAWDYLQCANSVACDIKEFEDNVSDHYYEYQIDDMHKRATELEHALEEGDWARLGLQRKSKD